MKWSTDAGFGKTSCRNGPQFSMRKMLPNPMMPNKSNSTRVFQTGDVHKATHAAKYTAPSYTMGTFNMGADRKDKTPGPTGYNFRSTMDCRSHPTIPKDQGARFGSATLLAIDSDGPPGPGEYDQEAFRHSSMITSRPKWVIEGREAWMEKMAAPGPGVGEYQYEKTMRNGTITPIKWTHAGKTAPIEPARGHERQCLKPAPTAYDPPGAPDCKNKFCQMSRPPIWGTSREPRGLL